MVRVCENELPLEFVQSQVQRARLPGFDLDPLLKQQIDIYLKNIRRDWDFVIIISGEGEVRVGKSFLASQIAMYWTSEIKRLYGTTVPFNFKENYVFHGSELIVKGNKLGTKHPNSALIFDEAGADLEGVKVMKRTTQAVKDFLRECGQYNLLTILILPEYFDLPKGIAMSRSNCLINVYWKGDEKGYMNRGYYKFYSRPNKKYLYLNGKKTLNYNAWRSDFNGSFDNLFTLDLLEYKKIKRKALKSREVIGIREERWREWLRGCINYMYDNRLSQREIAFEIGERCNLKIDQRTVGNILAKDKRFEEEES